MSYTDKEDEPIPEWAIGRTEGKYIIGAQLPTKDGRRTGNAHIIDIYKKTYNKRKYTIHLVLTDAGTEIQCTENELKELFYPTEWLSDVNRVVKRFGFPKEEDI